MVAPIPYKMRALSAGQQLFIDTLNRSVITFCDGPAGSGKTHIPVAHAVDLMRNCKHGSPGIKKIILCRPVVSASEEIGFLPGPLSDKLGPFMTPLMDELRYHFSREVIDSMIESERIEIAHMGMIRGRSFIETFVICDEAQNCTFAEIRLLMTRIGHHSKMTLCGDSTQSDLTFPSRFREIAEEMSDMDEVGFVTLGDEDIQRSRLIKDIEKRFTKLLQTRR